MGYNDLVSHAAGVSFPGAYVRAMTDSAFEMPHVRNSVVLRYFMHSLDEVARGRRLAREHIASVLRMRWVPFRLGETTYLGSIDLISDSFTDLRGLLQAYDLEPASWKERFA
jgi:hypothetical protein